MTWLTWPNHITIARILLLVPLVVCLLNVDAITGRSGQSHLNP